MDRPEARSGLCRRSSSAWPKRHESWSRWVSACFEAPLLSLQSGGTSCRRNAVRVSVNVSQVQLVARFVELVKATLARHDLEPSRLELEITETALMQDEGDAVEVLAELRAFGVRIALDDFGSGYSSLGMLRRLPIDVLKMDRAFVRVARRRLGCRSHRRGRRCAGARLRHGGGGRGGGDTGATRHSRGARVR